MTEASITSTFVSQVVSVGFADAMDAADSLVGSEITAGRARLQIGERIGDGLAGAAWYEGVLHTGAALLPTVRVDVVVGPWSASRSEIGIRPLSRLGRPDSLRAARFFAGAWSIIPQLSEALATFRPAKAPAAAVRIAA